MSVMGIGPGRLFGPISDVTGFSERDGLTHLEIQHRMREKLLELIAGQNNLNNYMRTYQGEVDVTVEEFKTIRDQVLSVITNIPPKVSLYVANFLANGATAAENTTAIKSAYDAAVLGGFDLCFDNVYCDIDNELDLREPGMRVWSSSIKSCRLTQTSLGKGLFYVWDDSITVDGFTAVGPLTDMGDYLDYHGFTGDPHLTSAVKLDAGVDSVSIRNIHGTGLFALVAGFPYPFTATLTDPEDYKFITNITIDNLSGTCWSLIRMSGLSGAKISNVKGSYKVVQNHPVVSGNPSHLMYLSNSTISTETPKAYSDNVIVSNCHAQDGLGGSAFSLRYIKGLTCINLTADNSEGLLDAIGVQGFKMSGLHSTSDKYPSDNVPNGNRASVSLLYCTDGQLDPCVVEGKNGVAHGSILYVGYCTDVVVTEPRGWVSLPEDNASLALCQLGGLRSRIVRPTVEARGTKKASIAFDLNDKSSAPSVSLENPACRGLIDFGVGVWPTATRQSIIYDPAKLEVSVQVIRLANSVVESGAPILNNTNYGYPKGSDNRVIAWHNGEVVAGSGAVQDRWASGHPAHASTTAAWVGAAPYLNANATATGLLTVDCGIANVEVSADVLLGTGATNVGFALRVTDANNFLRVVLDAVNIKVEKRVAGVYTQLASAALSIAGGGVWHAVRAAVAGGAVRVYVDGVLALSHTLAGGDEVTFAAQNVHGLCSNNGVGGSAWYRAQIKALG